jgi:hypothetical protein
VLFLCNLMCDVTVRSQELGEIIGDKRAKAIMNFGF